MRFPSPFVVVALCKSRVCCSPPIRAVHKIAGMENNKVPSVLGNKQQIKEKFSPSLNGGSGG